jgi:hypothetical protein
MPSKVEKRQNIVYVGGPRDGQNDLVEPRLPTSVGDFSEEGVYQWTNRWRGNLTIYRWQPITEAEADATLGDDSRTPSK